MNESIEESAVEHIVILGLLVKRVSLTHNGESSGVSPWPGPSFILTRSLTTSGVFKNSY